MYFFATTTDIEDLVAHMIAEWDFVMYEAYSRFNTTIRQITPDTNLSDFESTSGSVLLRGWREAFNSPPVFSEIDSSDTLPLQQRIELEGPTVFQIHSGHMMENGSLFPSYLNHWDEAGIRKLDCYPDEELDDINWDEVYRTSERLNAHITHHMAIASVSDMPILPNALRLLEMGAVNFWDFGSVIPHGSSKIITKKAA